MASGPPQRLTTQESGSVLTRRPSGRVHSVDDAVIVTPDGVLDTRCIEWLREVIARAGPGPVVLDLDMCALTDPRMLAELVDVRPAGSTLDLCIVCKRPTGRALLRHPSLGSSLTLFTHVEDAVTAWRMEREGFGSGWRARDADHDQTRRGRRSTSPDRIVSSPIATTPSGIEGNTTDDSPSTEDLPTISDVGIAVRHRGRVPGASGDFWDLFPTARGTHGLVIGDVTGSGPEAAAHTAAVRGRIRTAAAEDPRPDLVLRSLNTMLLDRPGTATQLTAVFARFRSYRTTMRMQLVRAGHPYPVVLSHHGAATVLRPRGQLLGAFPNPLLELTTIELRPGDALVLITDGLTDDRYSPPSGAGFDAVVRSLLPVAGATSSEIADAAFAHASHGSDDAAVIVLTHRHHD